MSCIISYNIIVFEKYQCVNRVLLFIKFPDVIYRIKNAGYLRLKIHPLIFRKGICHAVFCFLQIIVMNISVKVQGDSLAILSMIWILFVKYYFRLVR